MHSRRSQHGPGALETGLQITKLVYGPLSGLTVEGVQQSFYFDCLARASLVAAGQKSYDSPAEIGERLADFRTFNGMPLVDLLRGYGVHIERVDETPAQAMPREVDQPGDMVVALSLVGQPARKMPCGPNRWFKDPPAPIAESIRRADQLPVSDPEWDDSVLYWAHTGKCSQAYSF